jgi:hypothetical protein
MMVMVAAVSGMLGYWVADLPAWAGLVSAVAAGVAAGGLAVALNPHLRAEAGLVCAWMRSGGFRKMKERCLSEIGLRTAAPGSSTT